LRVEQRGGRAKGGIAEGEKLGKEELRGRRAEEREELRGGKS
jgi:hypothetical protein